MKPIAFFIGIDVAKLTLDAAVIHNSSVIFQTQLKNSTAGLRSFFIKIERELGCNNANSLVCVEQMGVYNSFICKMCLKRRMPLVLEHPLHLKRSLGLVRGKNDAADAVRIAGYASTHADKLRLWRPSRPNLEKLRMLTRLRTKLVKARGSFLNQKKLQRHYLDKKQLATISAYTRSSIAAMLADQKAVEKEIDLVFKSDKRLEELVAIVTSVPFIGKVIATEIIICTNEFEPGWTAKQFASYCGVAPFEYKSGAKTHGKPKVSRHANKSIKSLLHIAAIGVPRSQKDPALRNYYERKVKEGKHKLSVFNAICNKLIHRIFSCVTNKCLFSVR